MLDCGVVSASCQFPFTLNGATYSSCTTAATRYVGSASLELRESPSTIKSSNL